MKFFSNAFIKILTFVVLVYLYACHHSILLLKPQADENVNVVEDAKDKKGKRCTAIVNLGDIILTIKGCIIYPEKAIVYQRLSFEIENRRGNDIFVNPQKIYLKTCKNERVNLYVLFDGVHKIKPIYIPTNQKFSENVELILKKIECKDLRIMFEDIRDNVTGEVFNFNIMYKVEN